MATLYETTTRARRFVLIILVLIVAYLGITFFLNFESETFVINEAERFYMTSNRVFGDVAPPQIEGIAYDTDENLSFAVDGVFSEFPDIAYIYSIEEPKEKLLTFEEAQDAIDRLGFNKDAYEDLGDNNFRWRKAQNTQVLTFNKVLQDWEMTTSYFDNVSAQAKKDISINESTYASGARSLISRLGFNSLGLSDGVAEVVYADLGIDGVFRQAEDREDAEFIFIDVYRRLDVADLKPANEQPELLPGEERPEAFDGFAYSSDPRKGQLSLVVSNDMRDYNEDIFELYHTEFEYSANRGSYVIITPEEAWTKVQQGQGHLVLLTPAESDYFATSTSLNVDRYVVQAQRTELGYWEPEVWDGFVYPIYIFRGRAELANGRFANFVFYVDAIKRLE